MRNSRTSRPPHPRATPCTPRNNFRRMSSGSSTGTKMDLEAQSLWHEVATASDEVAAIVDRIPGLTVTGVETRNELERAAALLKAVAGGLRGNQPRPGGRSAPGDHTIL